MRAFLGVLVLVGLAVTGPASAGELVNLAAGARVCDAADCFVLSPKALSVQVWQTMPDGGVQFAWKGGLLTARAAGIQTDVQVCGWGSYRGTRTYLCDGYPARARPDIEARPRRLPTTPEVAETLKEHGLYRAYFPSEISR